MSPTLLATALVGVTLLIKPLMRLLNPVLLHAIRTPACDVPAEWRALQWREPFGEPQWRLTLYVRQLPATTWRRYVRIVEEGLTLAFVALGLDGEDVVLREHTPQKPSDAAVQQVSWIVPTAVVAELRRDPERYFGALLQSCTIDLLPDAGRGGPLRAQRRSGL